MIAKCPLRADALMGLCLLAFALVGLVACGGSSSSALNSAAISVDLNARLWS